MLTSTERRMLLEFLSKYADGDVLIQAANRVANNINDTETLREYIETYKPSANPNDYLSEKGKETPFDNEAALPKGGGLLGATARELIRTADEVEDLGPVPKKLGINGQNIHKLMQKEQKTWTVVELAKKLGIPASKVKPMLALLLERGVASRVPPNGYKSSL